ncbi:MAG TPA: hypothetical protein VHH88_04395 [Verrucomicrobiae bacterium]|nr:hypothetical protein [Verrucomicrobiae bacterium]
MKIKNRQQLLLILAIAVIALFAADHIIFTPLGNLWTSRSKEIAKLKNDVNRGQSLMRRQDSLREHWDRMRTNALPANRSLAEQQVLKAFDRWAQDSRLTVTSVSPQWRDTDDYSTLECRVEGTGSLDAVRRFLYDLEKDPSALRFESIEVSSRDAEGQQLSIAMQIGGLVLGGLNNPQ